MAFFQDNLGKPSTERLTVLDFTGKRDDRVALASAEPYGNHLHLAPDRTIPVSHHSVFTGWMPFLPPNQQRQSTTGSKYRLKRNRY